MFDQSVLLFCSVGAEILLVREFLHEDKRVAEVMLRQLPEHPEEVRTQLTKCSLEF